MTGTPLIAILRPRVTPPISRRPVQTAVTVQLAEVLAGAEKLQPMTRVPFPDNTEWKWSLSISETVYPDLLQLDVTVSHSGNSQLAKVEFSLRRWMRDPSLFLDAALKKKESQKTNGTTSTSK